MALTPTDALELARKMRMDLTQLQGRLTDIIEALAAIPANIDTRRVCPTCGITTRGPTSLEEHIHTAHDGPLPAAWQRAEQLAGIASDT